MYSIKPGGYSLDSLSESAVSTVPPLPPLRAAATGMVGLQELQSTPTPSMYSQGISPEVSWQPSRFPHLATWVSKFLSSGRHTCKTVFRGISDRT